MRKFFEDFFQAEQTIREYRSNEQWTQARNVTAITILAFLLMSALNVYQHSAAMLVSTLSAAALLGVSLALGWRKKQTLPMEFGFFLLLLILLTGYILWGGNEGFALLWVIFVPPLYTMMSARLGLILSSYFLVMLILVFYGPLDFLLHFSYPRMMLLRFPALYAIDYTLSLYIVRRMTLARSNLILAHQQIRQASLRDATTGLQNRAAYMALLKEPTLPGGGSAAVVFIDVNGLHHLNNTRGHQAGDEMLIYVADCCTRYFPLAQIFRLGGDEFLLLLRGQDIAPLREQMERMDKEIRRAGYSIAYGIDYQTEDLHLEDMVARADAQMLENKAEFYRRSGEPVR